MANNSKDLIAERLRQMNEQKDALKGDKPSVVQTIATGEEEKPDFMKMAEALEAQKEERVSANSSYKKDTIYIRKDLYQAMQALTNGKQGMKKILVNQAYEEFLTRKFKELEQDLQLDK